MVDALKTYLVSGGRHIDTAPDYNYEKEVGEVVRESTVPREEIWIASKVDTDHWLSHMGSPRAWALAQVDKSLNVMGLSYIDSMLLHFGPLQVARQASLLPLSPGLHRVGPTEYAEMWRGLVDARNAGKVRNIGVCESTRSEVENIINATNEVPAIAVTWYHPWVPKEQKDYVSWLQSLGVAVEAYGMLSWAGAQLIPEISKPAEMIGLEWIPGRLYRTDALRQANASTMQAARAAALRHNVTWAQLVLQWVVDQGIAFLTKMAPDPSLGVDQQQFLIEDLPCLDFHTDAQDEELIRLAPPWTCNTTMDMFPLSPQILPGCAPALGM